MSIEPRRLRSASVKATIFDASPDDSGDIIHISLNTGTPGKVIYLLGRCAVGAAAITRSIPIEDSPQEGTTSSLVSVG